MEEKQYLLDEVRREKLIYQFLSDEWRADVDIARASIEKFGVTLAFAPLWMKSDRELALLAVKADGRAIEFVNPALVKTDLEMCILALQKDSDVIELLDPALRMEEEVLLALLQSSWGYRPFKKYVPDALLRKKDFMMRAVAINGRLLGYAPSRIYMDPEVACIAARNCGRFAFKYLDECVEIPEVMREFELLQEACEAKMDEYILEQDPKKKDKLYYEVIRFESDLGIRSFRSDKVAYSEKEEVPEKEPKGIRFFLMGDEDSMTKSAGPDGVDPMRVDAIFHSENTSYGGFSYALSQRLKENLHLNATLVSLPLIDRKSSVSIRKQASEIMSGILETCRQNDWHRIRLTNFTYLKSCQFETFWGIALTIQEQADNHALTIYMDIDPDYVKSKNGDQLDFLIGPK
ncbi:DUF4116 domain-containing protein [Aquirufa sp. HETE-83D]|uniref:DUF4116 domain-containing protein n=1 Tax=Aquirufa esocilacus TaxID=3096513 RepID=A0ABW6DMJ4_9BACT